MLMSQYFLPPLNYPLCSIRPNKTVSNGNLVEFKCIIGETTERITLKWTLQSHDGSIIDLGDGTATESYLSARKTVTSEDNNSMFICLMTSETFPTVYRICSAGPLVIIEEKPTTSESITTKQPETNSTTETSQAGTSSTYLTTKTYLIKRYIAMT